jgi:hypothetical protein
MMMLQLQSNMGPNGANQRPRNNARRLNGNRTAVPVACHLSLYCWTHGACAHEGCDCRSPAEGHKPEATFQNRMNGSTKNISA